MNNMIKCQLCGEEFSYLPNRCEIDGPEIFDLIVKIRPDFATEFHGDHIFVCDDCHNKLFYYCDICHERLPKGKLCDCTSNKVVAYSNKTTVFPTYSGRIKFPKLRLGMEIETEFDSKKTHKDREKALTKFTEVLGKGLCKFKKDCSLGKKGVEFVTMPLFFEHFNALRNKFTKAFEIYSSLGGYSWSSERTGVHIHLSKKAFINKWHLYNFFIGMTSNRNFTRRIAKRSPNIYCEHPCDLSNAPLEMIAEWAVFHKVCPDRHTFVNFRNKDTIEVRVYKGNIKWSSTVVYLQHCYTMFEYSLLLTLNKIKFTVEDYRKYVLDNKARFPELAKEI